MQCAQFIPAEEMPNHLLGVAFGGFATVPFAFVPVAALDAGFDSALMLANSSGTIFFTLSSMR